MEDRQCDPNPRHSRSHHRLPNLGNASNARLPRAKSVTAGFPRNRSFQGKSPNPGSTAAQHGYHQRQAAKMYAQKRKAAAAVTAAAKGAQPSDDHRKPVGLINISVDHNGIKINEKGPSAGLGSRRNSRSKMTRSSSRRTNVRPEDKENMGDRPTEADINAYFSRKRGEKESLQRITLGETTSWDGSMPKRQNSKSFIERQPRKTEKPVAFVETTAQVSSSVPHECVLQQSSTHTNLSSTKKDVQTGNSTHRKSLVPAQESTGETREVLKDAGRVPSMSDISEPRNGSTSSSPDKPKHLDTTAPAAIPETESQSSGASYKSSLSKADSHTSEASSTTDAAKWCNDCAGVGLHIAALMADLKKYRPSGEDSAPGGSSPPTPRKGWKSMVTHTVLGDSKSKSQSEKARLQSEVEVLRATVEFLYKKVESMERGGTAVSNIAPTDCHS